MAQKTLVTSGVDQVVKEQGGRVNWIKITAEGAAAGDRWTLRDGGVTGTVIDRGVVAAANGSWLFPYVQRQGDPGLKFATSIAFTHDGADNVVYATICYD